MAHSRPLDLDHLDARLRDISSDATNSPLQARRRYSSETPRSSTPYEDREILLKELEMDRKEDEMKAYHDLVDGGGRPVYPVALLDDVFRKPEQYSELLRPWLKPFGSTGKHWKITCTDQGVSEDSGLSWQILQKQWVRWQDFRTWQRDNRWIKDDEGDFAAYAERYKDHMRKYLPTQWVQETLIELEADPSDIKNAWNRERWLRCDQQRFCREHHGGVKFADYNNAVKRRLARHGFTRPFELKEDLTQQDNLTTWIEYLCFEYWWLDRYTDFINRLKPDYDKAWQKLVDTKVLQPYQTEEYIATDECAMRRQADHDYAWAAWKRAQENAEKVYTSTQLDSHRLSIPKAERYRRLQAATHELSTANARLSSDKKRRNLISEFLRATWRIRQAKKDAARHRILLPWILDQILLIEAESGHTEAIEHESYAIGRTKKRLYSDKDNSWERDTKKRKLSCSSLTQRSDTATAKSKHLHKHVFVRDSNESQDGSRRVQAGDTAFTPFSHTLAKNGTAPQGLRRSARIAARRTTAGTAPIFQPRRRELFPRP